MLEINIERNHDNSFSLSTILKDGTRFAERFIGYSKSEAVKKFRKTAELENEKVFINNPNIIKQ